MFSRVIISNHAILRYAQRAMGLKIEESSIPEDCSDKQLLSILQEEGLAVGEIRKALHDDPNVQAQLNPSKKGRKRFPMLACGLRAVLLVDAERQGTLAMVTVQPKKAKAKDGKHKKHNDYYTKTKRARLENEKKRYRGSNPKAKLK